MEYTNHQDCIMGQGIDVPKYIAHSENSNGEVQTIKQHGEGVAEIMKSYAVSAEYADIYNYCGLLHDVGKYSEGFQKYIRQGGENNSSLKIEIKAKRLFVASQRVL